MGRPKKTEKVTEPKTAKVAEPKKKMKDVFRVMKEEQWRDFDNQINAREHLIKCLENSAITFCSLKRVKVEETGC